MRGLIAFVLFLLPASIASAQETLAPTEISDSPINEIGRRQSTRPVEYIDKEELRTEDRPRLDEALNAVPGVQMRLEGSPTFGVRGSQSSARSLVLEEGVPLNFTDGVGFNPLFVATENLGSAALLKGPSSSIFGHDAIGGVLELREDRLRAPKSYASYGSFNTNQVFAGAPFKISESPFQATVFETHTDGFRDRDDSELTRATLLGESAPDARIQWKTFHLFARQIGSTPGSLEVPSQSHFNNTGETSFIGFNGPTGLEGLSASFGGTYKFLSQNYDNSSPARTDSIRGTLAFSQKLDSFRAEIFDDILSETFQASYLPGGSQNYSLNEVGAGITFPFSETVIGQIGARISNETSSFVPSVGFEGAGPDDWKYFLNYSEGYHPASITQKFAQFQGFAGNPSLNAEHGSETDIGLEKNYGTVGARFEAFNRVIYNLIANQVTVPGTFTPVNLGRAAAYGFEGSASISDPVKASVSLDYLQNHDADTGEPVPLSPQMQISALVSKDWNGFNLAFQDTYWTSYYDRDILSGQLVQLNAWNTLDFFVGYRVSEALSARLAVLNIFDQSRQLTIGYPEPLRSFMLTMQGVL